MQHLLIRIAKVYPQALYYPLRTYLADNKPTGSPPPAWTPTPPKPPPGAAPAAAAPAAAAPAVAAAAAPAAAAGEAKTEEAKTETAPRRPLLADVEMTEEAESTVPLHGGAARILQLAFIHEHPQLLHAARVRMGRPHQGALADADRAAPAHVMRVNDDVPRRAAGHQ